MRELTPWGDNWCFTQINHLHPPNLENWIFNREKVCANLSLFTRAISSYTEIFSSEEKFVSRGFPKRVDKNNKFNTHFPTICHIERRKPFSFSEARINIRQSSLREFSIFDFGDDWVKIEFWGTQQGTDERAVLELNWVNIFQQLKLWHELIQKFVYVSFTFFKQKQL